MTETESFEADLAERGTDEPALVVDVEGFEGPLDLLLALARQQKVDLAKISILALADQYLVFIETARTLRLELAADYLVMAAWLAFLKSKLLIPKQPGDDGESGEELAAVLQFRLKRLEAMRDAAARLDILNRLIGSLADWRALDSFLVEYLIDPDERRTAIASSFAATLELVREGKMEMRQDEVFAPLYLRGRAQGIRAVEVA